MALADLTRTITRTKELAVTGDRLIAIGLRQAPALVRKATVPAIGTADAPAFTDDPAAISLLSLVARRSALGRLADLGAVAIPPLQLVPVGDDDPEPQWTGEGLPRPVARLSTESTYTAMTSYSLLLVMTKEFLKLGDQRSRNLVLSRALRGLVRGDDLTFLGTAAASSSQPAGILWNRTPIGAGSPADLQSDLENLYAAVADGRPFSPVFVLSGRSAMYLAASDLQAFKNLDARNGGSIVGIPCLISPSAANNLILVDASEIAFSDGGLEATTSEHASVQMTDTPSPGPVQMTSMFQSNSVALLFTRYLSWVLLRADAVQFVSLPIGGSPA